MLLLCALWLALVALPQVFAQGSNIADKTSNIDAYNHPYVSRDGTYEFRATNYREPYMSKQHVNHLITRVAYPLFLGSVSVFPIQLTVRR